jgi:pteridine reductase
LIVHYNLISMNMSEKIALVTGCAARIGREIAEHLHSKGYTIIVHYNKSELEAGELCTTLNKIRLNSAASYKCNLSNIDDIDKMINLITSKFNRLDILVNNASCFYSTPIGHSNINDWNSIMGSNALGPFFLSQGLYALLSKANGNIINMVDIYGERPLKNHTLYSMAKASLIMLTMSLAKEFEQTIRVNGIAPGSIIWSTNPVKVDTIASLQSKTCLKRQGSVQEILNAIDFLNEYATYTTGHILRVDGGRWLEI